MEIVYRRRKRRMPLIRAEELLRVSLEWKAPAGTGAKPAAPHTAGGLEMVPIIGEAEAKEIWADVLGKEGPQATKRKRGRPPGSKTKPRQDVVVFDEPVTNDAAQEAIDEINAILPPLTSMSVPPADTVSAWIDGPSEAPAPAPLDPEAERKAARRARDAARRERARLEAHMAGEAAKLPAGWQAHAETAKDEIREHIEARVQKMAEAPHTEAAIVAPACEPVTPLASEDVIRAARRKHARHLLEEARRSPTGGAWFDEPDAIYWALEAVHSSDAVTAWARSVRHMDLRDHEDSESKRLGSALHALLSGKQSVGVLPEDWNGRTDAGKAKRRALQAEVGDHGVVLTSEQEAHLQAMYRSLSFHPGVAKALDPLVTTPADREAVGVVWDEEFSLFRCIKADLKIATLGMLIDWKTTRNAAEHAFQKSAGDYGYFLQAAYYIDTANMIEGRPMFDSFVIAAVENTAPYESNLFEIVEAGLELGRTHYRTALARIRDARSGAKPAGYDHTIKSLVPPTWLFYR